MLIRRLGYTCVCFVRMRNEEGRLIGGGREQMGGICNRKGEGRVRELQIDGDHDELIVMIATRSEGTRSIAAKDVRGWISYSYDINAIRVQLAVVVCFLDRAKSISSPWEVSGSPFC